MIRAVMAISSNRQHVKIRGQDSSTIPQQHVTRLFSSSSTHDVLQIVTSSTSGRGFVATRRIRAGEHVLSESPIVSDSIEELAQVVLDTPALRDGLHMPARFPMREHPSSNCSQQQWSRAMAQATSNG